MIVLLSSSPIQTILFAALGPALPPMAAHLGEAASVGFASQMVMTVPALGIILGGLVSGAVVARFGVHAVLYASLAGYAAAGAGGLYLDSVTGLMISRFVLGFAVAHYVPCVLILVAQRFDENFRARLLGYQGGVSGVVSVSTMMASGALTEWGGWRAPFAIYLVALLVLACAFIAFRQSSPEPTAPARAQPKPTANVLRTLWPIYAVIVVLFIGVLMTSIQLAFLLASDGVTNAFSSSWIMSMGSVGSTVAGTAFGHVLARVGPRITRTLLAGIMGTGFIVIGIGGGVVPVAIGCLMSGLGAGMSVPYFSALLLAKAPPESRARALGLMLTAMYLADFINPLVITPLRSVVGIHGAFFAVGCVFFAAGIGMALSRLPAMNPVSAEAQRP
jgi:MFS family permease